MKKKGSITVFLALILSILLSLVSASLQSVQVAATRTQILNGMDIGLYSLFGQYDRFLLRDYDLFFLDGTQGGTDLNLAAVYDNFESYMKPILKQNSQKLKLRQGGFSGYRLATDEDGEVFYQQAVTYMKDTLGSQGVQTLVKRYKKKEQKVKQAEKDGKQAEAGNTLENYDSEMNSAAQKSQEAKAASKKEESGDFGDGTSGESFSDGEVKPQVVNPVPVIQRIRRMGLLDLVVPASKGISDQKISHGDLLSGRTLQQGMAMPQKTGKDNSGSAKVLFQQYLMEHLGNYISPSEAGLHYQLEYLLAGKKSDQENLKAVAKRLLLIREGINASCLMADAGKRAQIQALALAIASGFLIPPAAVAIEAALILCWSFAESILDLRELFHGGRVPLTKTAATWQLSLENLPNLLEGLDSQRRDAKGGMSYEDYLQVLLLSKSKAVKLTRGMDMIEVEIRSTKGKEGFRLDCCIEAAEISVDVEANRKQTFSVTRQYSYI